MQHTNSLQLGKKAIFFHGGPVHLPLGLTEFQSYILFRLGHRQGPLSMSRIRSNEREPSQKFMLIFMAVTCSNYLTNFGELLPLMDN